MNKLIPNLDNFLMIILIIYKVKAQSVQLTKESIKLPKTTLITFKAQISIH